VAARYRRTISATVAHRRATSPRAPISRWKMAENVYWLVTLNMPSAAIALWTSTASTPFRKRPSRWPRSRTRLIVSMMGRLSARMTGDFFRCRPRAWFSATTSRTKPSCSR